ncbi:ABC transporter substrate-binding protein [Allosalinactinospora lopnorensis]|uniref:ABC transporter substrate-binding protein n=1 Tax=Allosalinactinospora lopnorensis TaxID=1352348 RepID=UPI000623FFC5|nr:ABC transporter substrate-binding protein [Allosalinactinospora lopnorensis]
MNTRSPVLAAALAATLLLSSCAGAGEVDDAADADLDVAPGVTDDSVLIGTHQPLTGPAAPGYSQISAGAGAVFDYINDNGGIHGREIVYHVEDDAYDPTNTVEVTQDLVHREEIFAMVGGLGTPTHSKVVDFLNREGVPDLFVSSGALMWNQPDEYPLTYGYQVDYTREAKIQGEYIKENFPDADVGYLHQADDVGSDSQAGLDQYLKDQVVTVEAYESGQDDIGAQVEALDDAGAELVVCSCVPSYVAMMILEAQRIDFDPQFVVSSIGGDTITLSGLLEEFTKDTDAEGVPADALLDDLITTGYLPQVEQEEDPWIELFTEIHGEYIEDVVFSNTTIYGMAQAAKFAQVLEAAGQDLTRQTLIDALGENEFSGPGLVPFSTADDDHAGFIGAYISRFQTGEEPEILQEVRVTDNGDGPIEEFELDRPGPDEVAPFAGLD